MAEGGREPPNRRQSEHDPMQKFASDESNRSAKTRMRHASSQYIVAKQGRVAPADVETKTAALGGRFHRGRSNLIAQNHFPDTPRVCRRIDHPLAGALAVHACRNARRWLALQ